MADTVSSPQMSMPVPVVGTDPGPQWATDLNSCLGILDQHDHTPGLGVQITPNGLNINAALTMSGNFLTEVAGVTLSAQLTPPADGTLYLSGSDLYYVDGVGNNIRMTQSGSVAGSAGTITGLPSGTASASFGAGTFVFQAATNTGAIIDGASFILRNSTALSKGLTLSPPNAMGADYTLVLPPLPASQKIMTLDASGNMAAPYVVDNTTLEISSNTIQIKAGGVGTTQLADLSVTRAKLEAVGQQLSSSCGNFSTSSGSYVDITNLSISITTTGRPVVLALIPDGSANGFLINGQGSVLSLKLVRTSTDVGVFGDTPSGHSGFTAAALSVLHIDIPAAGTYTYKAQVKSGSGVIVVAYAKLIAYEL